MVCAGTRGTLALTLALCMVCGGTRGTQVLTLALFVVLCWDSWDTGSNTRSFCGFVLGLVGHRF